jgi:ABC-2 type transport system ATP-binding protein
LIAIRNIYKYYKETIGLHKIYLDINEGEVVGILGANGAGKTTMLKAICNLLNVGGGEVLIDGDKVVGKVYNKISYISEEGTFFPYMTPEEHLVFYEMYFENFNRERFNKLINYFKLDGTKKLSQFSKGEKSKFEVVCGFCKGAKYILMDEPFLGNDVFTRKDFFKLMISSLKSDETLVLATHLVEEIDNLLDRAIILEEGRIKEIINMEELKEKGMNLTDVIRSLTNYDENKILNLID